MKRTFAAVALLAALGILFKLAVKYVRPGKAPDPSSTSAHSTDDPEVLLRARYTREPDRALVDRTLARFRQTAVAIERTDGLRGLTLLDRLDIEAVYLYEKRPGDFRRLRDALSDESAAEILLHWREYFGLKRADDVDRGVLIDEIARLSPSQRKAAARFPIALPLILAEPTGVTDLIERWSDDPKDLNDLLVLLQFVSLETGAADLRHALRTVEDRGQLALRAFRVQGLDGFALVSLYGPVLEALGGALPLDQALILLRVNARFIDERLQSHRPETVAADLSHAASLGLVETVGGSPNALRLLVEHGGRGEQALRQAGPDAADVVYDDFTDPTLRNQAVEALAEQGLAALAMLDKYASDPDFRDVLRAYGAAAIPPLARADGGPEALSHLQTKSKRSFSESVALSVLFLSGDSGQATIRMMKRDGLARVNALDSTDVAYYQFLPLYDMLHLGNVLKNGYTPTAGEMTWALVDAGFVILDAVSLAAVQPEGVAASEVARAEVKAATREAAKLIGREVVEDAAKTALKEGAEEGLAAATEKLSRWWAVRSAGGTFKVFQKMPEALPRLGCSGLTDLGRPLAAKAGLRLSTWGPVRLLKDGQEFILRIPPERGLKYLGVQVAQAGVGVVGFRKMEEHLASRRPQNHLD
jgi:hypothetical protein